MRHATRLPTVLATRASRRAFLQRPVVIGATLLVIGSVLAWRCRDDADYPAVGALRLTDGAVLWSVHSPDEAYRSVIGATEDIVLIEESRLIEDSGSPSHRTIALDAADGSERWRRATGHTPTTPGPIDGQGIVVLVDQDARALVGVDVLTGEERWRVESSDVPLANSLTVAVVWDVAGPGGTPSRYRGINRVTGDELWVSDTHLSARSDYLGAPSPAAVLGEVVVVPTGATVTAIDLRTGAMLWQAPQLDPLGAADGVVVGMRATTGPAPSVTALDAASGQQRWTAPGRPPPPGFHLAGDGVIVVMDAGDSRGLGLIAYELSSGTERWRVTLTHSFEPQLISGTSLVMLGDGELAVLSTTDGATIWAATQPFGSPLMTRIGSNGDAVFVAINSLPWSD